MQMPSSLPLCDVDTHTTHTHTYIHTQLAVYTVHTCCVRGLVYVCVHYPTSIILYSAWVGWAGRVGGGFRARAQLSWAQLLYGVQYGTAYCRLRRLATPYMKNNNAKLHNNVSLSHVSCFVFHAWQAALRSSYYCTYAVRSTVASSH